MTRLTGLIELAAASAVRVYSVEVPGRFQDVGRSDVSSVDRQDDLTGVVTVIAGATITEGTLEQHDFADLFTSDGHPRAGSIRLRKTSLELCLTKRPPDGFGYC